MLQKFIRFIRTKGFEKIYLPELNLANTLYDRENPYVPVYTSLPKKLQFEKSEIKDFHSKVDGKKVWVLANSKNLNGYEFVKLLLS